MKTSDIVTQFLVDIGISDLFLISGGGMMHLLDRAARQKGLNLVFNLDEQASSICTESYAQYTGKLDVQGAKVEPGELKHFDA